MLFRFVYVKLEDTIRDAADILAGKYDDKPESWFYMVQGTLSDQVARDAAEQSKQAGSKNEAKDKNAKKPAADKKSAAKSAKKKAK